MRKERVLGVLQLVMVMMLTTLLLFEHVQLQVTNVLQLVIAY